MRCFIRFLLLFLVAGLAAFRPCPGRAAGVSSRAAPAVPVWTGRLEIAVAEALGEFAARWDGGGLEVRLSEADGGRPLTCLARCRRSRLAGEPADVFDAAFHAAARATAFADPATNVVTVAVRRRRQTCTLFVQGRPALSFPDRWRGALLIATRPAAVPPEGDRLDYVQHLGPFRFEDNFLVPEGTPDPLRQWEIVSGVWRMHTVTGNVSGTLGRELRNFPTPERSPNFYSLEGQGSQAAILSGEPFQDHYVFQAAVQHNAGTNGLLFLVTEEGNEGHAFTVQTDPGSGRLVFALWRGGRAGGGPGRFVEGVATDLLPGQWLLLEVRLHDDRVICLVDRVEVMRRRLALPPGGRFGLYSDAPGGTRFDDVAVWSHTDLAVDVPADLTLWLRRSFGELEEVAAPFPAPVPAMRDLPFASGAHWLKRPGGVVTRVFGATNDPPRRLDLALQPLTDEWEAMLLAGWTAAGAGHYYRLRCAAAGGELDVRLEEVADGKARLLDAIRLPAAAGRTVVLGLDALRPGELQGLVDGRLALWHALPGPAAGAVGFHLPPRTGAAVALPLCRSGRTVLTDRFEKNQIYITDPFMRHWASPEGQWLPYPDGRAWYKSDVLRQAEVRVPAIEGTTLHLAVPEGQSNGTLRVTVADATLTLLADLPPASTGCLARLPLAALPVAPTDEKGGELPFYTARLLDHHFLLACDTGLLARCRIPLPPPGRMMMIAGMTVDHLRHVRVRREPVLDCLFTESLHDWQINGGTWEVINRFQCSPAWSHMNGENADSLAALWSKHEIEGDFSIEFNAGMRQGWYHRPGDLNLTIMNRRDTPGEGYTVTCAGWDPDHSQEWTRLFRDGRLLQSSDRYTVPRTRQDSQRKGYEPLLAGGRDVHGAWYTLRLRRHGRRLRFDFDNETILEAEDPEPLPAGSFGIWTYRNSMMVARVRVAAEAIRPRPFLHRRLALPPAPPAPAAAPPAAGPDVRVNGLPAEPTDERWWAADDEVSRPRLEFRAGPGQPELRLHARQGGGTFLLRSLLPEIPAARLIGWRFEVARHPEARFNFEYDVGKMRADAGFVPEASCSHVICGSEETRGPRRPAGRLARPPAATPPGEEPVWTPVVAWLPVTAVADDAWVRVAGFGNLQPGDIQQGLAGNPPGVWYAVRGFRPIFRGVPEVSAADTPETARLRRTLAEAPVGRLNTVALPGALDPREPVVEWGVMPAGETRLAARPAARPPDSIRVTSTLPWPNPLLAAREARVNGVLMEHAWVEDNVLVVPMPRPLPARDETIRLDLVLSDGREFRQLFSPATIAAARDGRDDVPRPPVLIGIDLPDGAACYQNFETRTVRLGAFQTAQPPVLRFDDPRQQAYLRFENRGTPSRLQGVLARSYDMVAWPLLQFRFRGDPMARVSLNAKGFGLIRFTENLAAATHVRPLCTASVDRAWHSWIGMPADACGTRPLRQGCALAPADIAVGSAHRRDQTGLYSMLDIDELAAGPVAGGQRKLAFRVRYDAPDGIAESQYALLPGDAPWDRRAAAERDKAVWLPAATNTWLDVPVDTLAEGVHHLVARARGAEGGWSRPGDVPFLVDHQPVQLAAARAEAPGRWNGTMLVVNGDTGAGALPRLETLRVLCDGRPLDLRQDRQGTVSFRPGGFALEIDWPWLLRREIQAGGDGTSITLRFEELTDACGRLSPPAKVALRLDYAADKTPPTVLPPHYGTNFLWFAPAMTAAHNLFQIPHGLHVAQETADGFGVVILRAAGKDNFARRRLDPLWDTARHPFLALSLRLAPDAEIAPDAPVFHLRFRPRDPSQDARKGKFADGSHGLDFNAGAVDAAVVKGNVKWEPGRWNDLIVDVDALLRRESGAGAAPQVRDLDISLPGDAAHSLQFRAAAIMSAWNPGDLLVLRAYDASGIEGLFWQGGGHAPLTALRPARVALPADDPVWMKLTVRDRAGNSTAPFLLPIPPSTSAPPGLPVAEDWND
jgi:hypothetical protein